MSLLVKKLSGEFFFSKSVFGYLKTKKIPMTIKLKEGGLNGRTTKTTTFLRLRQQRLKKVIVYTLRNLDLLHQCSAPTVDKCLEEVKNAPKL